VDVNTVNVAVMAPVLGADLSYVTDVDRRVQALDANGVLGDSRHGLPGQSLTPDRVNDILAVADVLLVGFPVPDQLAGRAPRLAWAHHTQAGVSNLAGSDLWTSPVTLTTSRGAVGATAIAEYVMAAASYFARGLQEGARQKQDGVFTAGGYELTSLRGATMGVLGLGGIGREVARLARAAGLRVIATRRSLDAPAADTGGADLVLPASRILQVAAESDFLAVCSQLTPETRGLVGSRVFAAMKPGAVLINIARGEEVDEDALIAAVTTGRIRGAVLDVYDGELAGRPPRAELLSLPQILLTPHISTRGDAGLAEPVRHLFAENLRRFLDGRPLLNVVDRDRGY
jgi:phosphoglycerate dehydrogenase-like enzyme